MHRMIAAKNPRMPGKTFVRLLSIGLAAAIIFGLLVIRFASDRVTLPEMAAEPITLSTGHQILVQRFEVAISEWNTCAAKKGCDLKLRTRPDQPASTTPATGLSYVDVQQYVSWINRETGHRFRLPTAAEWVEMAAPILPDAPEPIFSDPALTWASAYLVEGTAPRALKPQGIFSITREGIADLDGSVWEWTQDCYSGSTDVQDPSRCPAFYVGGEHLAAMSYLVRNPARGGCAVGTPPAHLGMRLVLDTPI